MKKIIVLGAGMVGGAIAADLCSEFDVTAADINEERLNVLAASHHLKILMADLSSNDEIKKIINDFDIVVGAVPGFMGFETVKSVIEAGKNIVDISFFEQDPFLLDDLAKENNVTAVVDCGVAPGMSSIILGYHNSKMKIESFECYVGGLPADPTEACRGVLTHLLPGDDRLPHRPRRRAQDRVFRMLCWRIARRSRMAL